MNLTPEKLADLKTALYTVNWSIRKQWGNDAEQAEALRQNILALDILTDGAYSRGLARAELATVPVPVPAQPSVNELKIEIPDNFKVPANLVGGTDFPIVGRRFTPGEFIAYLRAVGGVPGFVGKGITMHHMASPNLSMRPDGLTEQHMMNLRDWYRNSQPGSKPAWKSGPHIFTDDHGIWVHTPLHIRGVHAESFNSTRYGIEMLGDFSTKEDFDSPRGKKSMEMGQFAAAALMRYFSVPSTALNFHRHDPETSKDCPGRLIDFEEFEAATLKILEKLPV